MTELLARLRGVERSGAGWVAICPVHGRAQNLAVSWRGDHLYCRDGCTIPELERAMRLAPGDLSAGRGRISTRTDQLQGAKHEEDVMAPTNESTPVRVGEQGGVRLPAEQATDNKVAVNRRNPRRPTGPRAITRKRGVRHNRLRDGLFARDLIIPAVDGPHALREFERLLTRWQQHYEPVDVESYLDVEDIAVGLWMRRRVMRCLRGETLKQLQAAQVTREEQATRLQRETTLLALADKASFTRTPEGLDLLTTALHEIRAAVERQGHLSEDARARLVEMFPLEPQGLVAECLRYSVLATTTKEDAEQPANVPSPAQCRAEILRRLDAEHERLLGLKRALAESAARAEELDQLSAALPDSPRMARILACDIRYERQIERARNRLERRLAQRRGERVLPPVTVDLSA